MSTLAEMAGIAESTVCKIVMKVCNAIIENLSTDAVDRYFPKSVDDFRNKLQKMECEKQYMLLLEIRTIWHTFKVHRFGKKLRRVH